jgi:flagellar biosynthetic protein FlhB
VREYGQLGELELLGILSYLQDRVYALVLAVLLLSTALAVADYGFQHWRFMEKMKMTKQELRDEHKQSEGDPMVKMKLRTLRSKRARQRMMQAVPSADVVVTNPTHYAVALKYEMDTMSAPVLVAKGGDLVAKRIRELAEENEVPIVENPPLARALFATVELDQEVPPEHYKAVAEVISYVMRLKSRLGK